MWARRKIQQLDDLSDPIVARALVGARVGDERIVRLPAGEKSYEVIGIRYPT